MAAALVFVLCFAMVSAFPAAAAEKGHTHHVDTFDYCLRASDVIVKMSELRDLDESQKKALVESTSDYTFYQWKTAWKEWGEPVSAAGDFSRVDWNREGSYMITVRLPSLAPGVFSEISYFLKIIDDLPAEPEPVPDPPAVYRVTVRYLEEESGLSLQDDYVSEEIEEGSFFTIGEDILLAPEGYELIEIRGDREGYITQDSEILVICRKSENEPGDAGGSGDTPSDEPEDPESGDPPNPGDPDPGQTDPPEDPAEQENQGNGKTDGNSGKTGGNSGKPSGKGSGKGSGKQGSSSSSSSGNKAGADKPAKDTAAAAQAVSQAAGPSEEQHETPPQAAVKEQTAPEGTVLPEEAEELPEEAAAEEVPGTDAGRTDTALAGQEGINDESSLGGAILPQANDGKEKYPLWTLTLSAAEAGILAVLGAMIVSDVRLLLWFEEKKKR